LAIELPGDTTDESSRNKYSAEHESNGDDRATDLVHRLHRGLDRCEAERDVALDIFDYDDGVIDDDADGEHESEQ